jgi:hypothetical protein
VFGAFFRAARCFWLDGLSPGLLRPIGDQRLARATFARRFTEAASAFRKGGAAAAAPVDSATTA